MPLRGGTGKAACMTSGDVPGLGGWRGKILARRIELRHMGYAEYEGAGGGVGGGGGVAE